MKGISIWMFSKIIMLVFVLATFSTLMGFMSLTKNRMDADSADALTMQIKDSIETALHASTVSSQAVVPIPYSLVVSSTGSEASVPKPYTVTVGASGGTVYAAIGWGDSPSSYVAASSFIVDTAKVSITNTEDLTFSSRQYKYFVVLKEADPQIKLCFQACNTTVFGSSASCVGCMSP